MKRRVSPKRFRSLPAAALLALMGLPLGAQEVWIGSGNWSVNSNWLDGSAPALGGDPTASLLFTSLSSTSTNDLSGAFALNRLVLASDAGPISFGFTLAGGPGASLRLTGSSAQIVADGLGSAAVSIPLTLDGDNGQVTVTGSGPGGLSLQRTMDGNAGLVIATTPSAPDLQPISLGASASSRLRELQSGNIRFTNSVSGSGSIAVRGGTISFSSSSFLARPVELFANLVIRDTENATISSPISSAVAATGLSLRTGPAVLTLLAVSGYTGVTLLDVSPSAVTAALGGGTLQLAGTGALSGTLALDIRAGSKFIVQRSTTGLTNRLRDTAAIHLRQGELMLDGLPGVETVGAITTAGFSTLTLAPNPGAYFDLRASSLTRPERGTLLVRAPALGGSAVAGSIGLHFTTAPTLVGGGAASGSMTSIIPFVIGDPSLTGTGTTFATYNAASGVRFLNTTTDFATSVSGNAPTVNLRLASGGIFSQNVTFNSLLLESGNVSGLGAVTIQSGALLTRGLSSISSRLTFGTVEANVFSVGPLTIAGVISGSGGLTKSGAATLTLSGANDFTGPLTINAGTVFFGSVANLGADASPIVLNGHLAALAYTGTTATTLARGISTRTGVGALTVSGDFTLAGAITGEGGMRFETGSTKTLTLAGTNTYSGATRLSSAIVRIASSSPFGTGPIELKNSALAVSAPWTTNSEITVTEPTTVSLGSNMDVNWDGPLVGAGPLSITGATGTLRLGTASPYSGDLTVSGAGLELRGTAALLSSTFTLSNGARLVLDNTVTPDGARIADAALVSLSNSALILRASPVADVTERLRINSIRGSITLSNSGPRQLTLRLSSSNLINSDTLVRGDNLGGAADGPFTRIAAFFGPGFIPGLTADASATGLGSSFAIHDPTVDAAGVVGLRALRADEFTSGSAIQNPANGGNTPVGAHFLTAPAANVIGATNTVQSLTLPDGGSLSLSTGQNLGVTSGGVFARGAATISGGTIDFGTALGMVHTLGNVNVTGVLTGSGGLRKSGSGVLTFLGTAGYTGTTNIAVGGLRIGSDNPFASRIITLATGTTLSLRDGQTAVGGLLGTGAVAVGNGSLTVGTAPGATTFSGNITGNGTLTITNGGGSTELRSFTGSSTFSGTTILESGRLQLSNFAALGTGPLVVKGGSLRGNPSFLFTGAATLQLDADLHVLGTSRITFAAGTTVSGPGRIVVGGTGGLGITGSLAVPGGILARAGAEGEFAAFPGNIEISGAAGALTSAGGSGVRLESGRLLLNDAVAFTGGAGGRLGDTIPVHLGGSTLELGAGITASQIESIGGLSATGLSAVVLSPTTSTSVQLTASALNRLDRATLIVRSGGVLGTAAAPNIAQFKVAAPPTLIGGGGAGPAIGIVPWVVSWSGSTIGLATYDANGFRTLLDSEYRSTLDAAGALENVRLLASEANAATRTVNALVLSGASVTGAGTLTIGSGVILQNSGSAALPGIIANTLDFGAAEAQFHFPGNAPGALRVTGEIRGSGGLTKSGSGALYLTGANSFTGSVTINGGPLYFSAPQNLGAGAEPIALHNDAQLIFNGSSAATLLRDIDVRDGVGTLATSDAAATFDLGGNVSGPGRVRIAGPGFVVLNAGNPFAGPLVVEGGAAFSGDSALGSGASLVLGANGNLRLEAPWTSARRISVEGAATLDTNSFDAVLDGPLSGTAGSLAKAGAGSLTLRSDNPLTAPVTVRGGELVLSGGGALKTANITLATGGLLSLDNSATNLASRLPDTAVVNLHGGQLRLEGGAEKLGALVAGAGSANTVTFGTSGGVLTFESFAAAGSALFRSPQLGGNARVFFTQNPALSGGVIPGAFADVSANGTAVGFAAYDASSGVRALMSAEITSGLEIRNPSNGGVTPTNANFFTAGAVTAGGALNAIDTLTLAPSTTVSLDPAQGLAIGAPGVLAHGAAAINGGWLSFGAQAARFHTIGDLRLASEIDAPLLQKTGGGVLRFAPPSAFRGAVNIDGGTLQTGAVDVLRGAVVTVFPGAALDLDGNAESLRALSGGGSVLLGGADLRVVNASAFTGTISGAGGFSAGSFAITRAQPYSGPTTFLNGTFTVSGAGALPATSSLTLSGNALLNIISSPAVPSRLGTIPVRLNHGRLALVGNDAAPATQTFGALTGSGFSTISAQADGTRQPATLNFGTLTREDRGTFNFVNGIGVTGTVVGDGKSTITFDASLASHLVGAGGTPTKTPILPFALSSTSFGLVTFAPASGVRTLALAEYSPTLTTGDNVRLTTATTHNSDVTINALVLGANLSGAGTLSIESGVLLPADFSGFGASLTLSKSVSFGASEGVIFNQTDASSLNVLAINSELAGSGGLTLAGRGITRLRGVNTFTGPLTINSTSVSFSNMANFGADTSEITLNDATLIYEGSANLTFTRPIRLTGAKSIFTDNSSSSINGNLVTYALPLSGPGGVEIARNAVFTAANAYAGDTTINNGVLRFASDAALGTGANVFLGGTIVLNGPWVTSRAIETTGVSTINTGGFDAQWLGPLTGSNALTKTGAGVLRISEARGFGATLAVTGGTVRLESTASGLPNRIGDSAALTLAGGAFVLAGHPAVPTTDRLGAIQVENPAFSLSPVAALSRIVLEAPGLAPVLLRATGHSVATGALAAITGPNLGGGPSGVFSRLQFDAATLVEGALPGFVIFDANNQPLAYATYDSTQDAAGPIGVRPLRSSEFLATPLIANSTNGGTTPTRANLRIAGPVAARGASNTIETLTFASGGTLTLDATQTLILGSRSFLSEAGATGASLRGGTLNFGNGQANFLIGGEFTIASRLANVSAGVAKYGAGTLTWSAPLPVATNFLVSAGILRVGTPDALAGGRITIDPGATLQIPNLAANVRTLAGSGDVQIDAGGMLTVLSSSTFPGAIHGAGTLRIGGVASSTNNLFVPTGMSDLTGRIFVDGTNAFYNGLLQFTGPGRFTHASEVVARAGGTVEFQTPAAVLPAHIPITLESGKLSYDAGFAIQTAGVLTARGMGTVSITTDTASSGQVIFDDISTAADNSGQFYFFFRNATAGAAPGPGVANVRFNSDLSSRLVGAGLGLTDRPILPFAVGGYVQGASSLTVGALTYSSNGLRFLTDAEYAIALTPGANVRLGGAPIQNTNITVNSLTLQNVGANLSGSGTVRVASGLILAANGGSIQTAIDFANRRGSIFSMGSNAVTLTGKISGSAGLAIGGSGASTGVVLTNPANDFTGPIDVNSATLSYTTPAALGAASNPIVLNGGTLQYSGSSPEPIIAHPIEVGPTGGTLASQFGHEIIFTAPITGTGNLILPSPTTFATSITYSGALTILSRLTLAASPELGPSPVTDTAEGLLLTEPWSTTASSSASLGFDATLAGQLSYQGATGNDVEHLVVVPEPGTTAFIATGLLVLGARRRALRRCN